MKRHFESVVSATAHQPPLKKTAVGGAARTLFRQALLPAPWMGHDDKLIVAHFGNPSSPIHPGPKIAAFDFDGTLAKTSLFKKGPTEWSTQFPHVYDVLQCYHRAGYAIVIFSNEGPIGKCVKIDTIQSAIDSKMGRLSAFAAAAQVPMHVLVATEKKITTGSVSYRKPARGMFAYFERICNKGWLSEQLVDSNIILLIKLIMFSCSYYTVSL